METIKNNDEHRHTNYIMIKQLICDSKSLTNLLEYEV